MSLCMGTPVRSREQYGVHAMTLSRRGFIKLSGATLASSSLSAMGFGGCGAALAELVRPNKLAAAKETRNTCTYCSCRLRHPDLLVG